MAAVHSFQCFQHLSIDFLTRNIYMLTHKQLMTPNIILSIRHKSKLLRQLPKKSMRNIKRQCSCEITVFIIKMIRSKTRTKQGPSFSLLIATTYSECTASCVSRAAAEMEGASFFIVVITWFSWCFQLFRFQKQQLAIAYNENENNSSSKIYCTAYYPQHLTIIIIP